MGIAGATIAPSTLSLIFTMFLDSKQRSTAIGVWIAAYSAGGAIGPVLGGVLLEFFWWGSVFLIGVPVMGLLLLLGPRTLPEYRDPDARPLDLLSAAMSLLAILGVVYGLKQLAQDGVSAAPALVIVLGLLIGYVFVRRQLRLESPMIDVRLFRIRAFSASLGTYFFGIFVVVGYFLFISQYLQLILGLSPLEAAIWSLPSAVGFIVGSTIAPRIIHRFRPSVIMGVGMAIAAAGHRDAPRPFRRRRRQPRAHRRGLGDHLARPRPGDHARDRADRGQRPAGAGRRRNRDLGNERRARRRAGDRDPRQPGHGRLPSQRRGLAPIRHAR